MRELTLTGDVCNVLKKIQELTDGTPTGKDILYRIENWDPRSIKATDEKRNLETLDAMYHVIKIKGNPFREAKALVFAVTKTKSFEEYFNLNCKVDLIDVVPNKSSRLKIHVSELKGLYREDNPQLRYEIRGKRKQFILNLLHGYPIDYGMVTSRASNTSNAVADINRLTRLLLKVDFDVIDHSDSSSYFLNEAHCSYIEDALPTVTVSHQ